MNNMAECRVCGKLFIPCNKTSDDLKAFNYRCCACSPECGAEYLHRIMISRGLIDETKSSAKENDEKSAIEAPKKRSTKK